MEVVNLTNCDREPIHILGKIQSQGFIIAVHQDTFDINYCSENVTDFLDVNSKQLLGKHINVLSQVLADNHELDLLQVIKLTKSQNVFDAVNPYKILIKEDPFYLVIHQSSGQIVLEFEIATLEYDIQSVIGKSVSEILSNKTLDSLLSKTAQEVKQIIDYDRVMIYKFHDDGHGEVVAEACNEELDSWFGLHYPASDIPKQARELYKLNMTRIIADVNTESSPIATILEDQPLDLTYSILRAVSPIHIQYLKNMGVASSFSISLISEGELWGLIACHNYTPKFIDFRAREGTKLIGQILSSGLEYRQLEENSDLTAALNNNVLELSSSLERDDDVVKSLIKQELTLMDATHATGAVLVFEDQLYKLGQTPNDAQIKDLARWLKLTMKDSVYHTTQLSAVYREAKEFVAVGAGVLVCMLSKEMGEMVIWFKPEQIQTINWAGNPEKPMSQDGDGLLNLSPRNSFALWAEIVKNTSSKWTQSEITSVLRLRERIVNTINKKANEIRLLNERLKLAYEELDTFSYTVSHDLRTPLTSIKSYTELFLSKYKDVDDQGKKLLSRVIAGAEKMSFLIDEILKLARVGRTDLDLTKIEVQPLMDEIIQEVKTALKIDNLLVNFGELPTVLGDKTLIGQVFNNIIGNAIKYSSKGGQPEIWIDGQTNNDETVYKIRDNGIGIDVNYHDKVFELFKRMENVKDFEGTGVGLAIVKRIMERHDGRIWFDSELGKGTTFYLAFKK